MTKKDSRYVWYLLDMCVFLVINAFILTHLPADASHTLEKNNLFTFFILGLGVYRLTDIITQENVTEPFRAPFMDKVTSDGKESWRYSRHGFRGFCATLLSCNACMGVWVAMSILYLFLFFTTPTLIFMMIMTLTGLERFFSKIENVLAKRS